MSRLTVALLVPMVVASALLSAGLASAQSSSADEEGAPRFLLVSAAKLAPLDVERTPVLGHRLALDLDGTTLREALAKVASQSGLRLTYSDDVLPPGRRVRLQAQRITVVAALTDLLYGTGLDVVFQADGRASLVERHPTRARQSSRQGGTIIGTVTDAKTGKALAAVDVILEGGRWRATTDTNGQYRLAEIDSGRYTLLARRLGYAKQSRPVTVAEGRTDTVNLALAPMATRLDEIVTTATGRRRRVELANDITTINADSVMRTEPVKSLTDILETRVPGLTVQHTSGAPGDPSRLRLRGAGSPLQSNDPIVVVDGVRVYAEQSAARSANLAVFAGSTVHRDQYATPSPLDNIDPNTIETIEVLKGPSAATLYGQDAANGVIVVTTKKGKAGPPRWTALAEHGTNRIEGNYPNLMLRWGHPLQSSAPVICPISNQTDPSSLGGISSACEGDSVLTFQLLNDPALTVLGKGQSTRASLGVSGGSTALTYNLTGSYGQETGLPKLPAYEADRYQTITGTTPPDWMQRPQHLINWGVTSGLGMRLGKNGDIALTTSLTRTQQQRSSLEDNLSALMTTYLDRSTGTYYHQSSTNAFVMLPVGFQQTGCTPGIGCPTTTGNLLLDDYFSKVTDDAVNFTNAVNATWRARSWLTLTTNAGLNWIQRSDQLYTPRFNLGGGAESSIGEANYARGSSLVTTAEVRGNIQQPLGHGFQFRFATGANYASTVINDFGIASDNLPDGKSSLGTHVVPSTPNQQNDATFGWFVEPAVDNSRLYLNLGLRLDGGSSYGSNVNGFRLPSFPKLGFSYLISDEPFYPFKNIIPTLRLRMAYGRASRQPGVTDHLRLYGAPQTSWVNGAFGSSVVLEHIGNADVRPERSTEFEGGFDTDLLDSRLSLQVSGYRKTTDDALLPVPVAPSVYGTNVSQIRNIGVIRNTGLELTVDGQLIRSAQLTWSVGVILTQNRDIVVRLAPGVTPFFTEGTSNGGGIRVAPGYPLNSRWAKPILGYADANGNGVIDQEEILLGDTAVYVGATMPNYAADVHTNIALWRGAVNLSATLHHENGLSQKNNVAQSLVFFSPGRNDPSTPLAEQVATSTVTDYNWVQTVNATRLNSLSMSYRIPAMLARRVGAQQLSIAVQGTNLRLWTNYRGMDPNVNAFSTGNSVLDAGTLPQPRLWQLRVNATY